MSVHMITRWSTREVDETPLCGADKTAADTWGNRTMMRIGKRDGLIVGGCGMDMGFHVVYNLSRTLYRDSGFTCVGDGCPSNDHSNGDRNREPHAHSDGGYALKQRWV